MNGSVYGEWKEITKPGNNKTAKQNWLLVQEMKTKLSVYRE